jgi:hypothetical protein
MLAPAWRLRLASMTKELPTHRVEVSFVGAPPARQIERASGVSEVEVDGQILRCLVCGSFQPFLEALRGHEVVNLSSTPASARAPEDASDVESNLGVSGSSAPKPTTRGDRK